MKMMDGKGNNSMSKKVCFVLYNTSAQASGGYKMVYMYANLLAERGHKVSIMFMNTESLSSFPTFIRIAGVKYLTKKRPTWYELDRSIEKLSWYPDGDRKQYDFDCVIATELKTADFVDSHFEHSKKAYFIQDYENWGVSEDVVQATYRLDMKKIVISDWLKEIVDQYSGCPSVVIKNPIDLEIYKVKTPPAQRNPYTVGMLYHANEYKGCHYAVEALKIVKKRIPELKVYAFGTADWPDDMPGWFAYTRNASQEDTVEIYNKCLVWTCATIEEGFGLTGLEAMACGCALASTDYRGIREYAVNGYNSLLSPVKDCEALAESIIELLEKPERRMSVSGSGLETVKEFGINKAIRRFEETIIES